MKTSNEIGFFSKLVGEHKTIELYAQAGFDAWDFTLTDICKFDYTTRTGYFGDHPLAGPGRLKFARELRHIGEEMGIFCNQSHAPFPVSDPLIRDSLKHAIECTAEAGGEICIVHPNNNKSAEENAEMYFELLPFAKACGVKMATENMWNLDKETGRAKFAACATEEDFCKHIDMVNDPYLIACLDIGHAEMMGDTTSAVKMIHALGNRLQALHIHDNDKIRDSHQIPFSMEIDFDPIVKALAETKYSGVFTLECCMYPSKFTAEDAPRVAKDLADAARKLADKYDEYLKL